MPVIVVQVKTDNGPGSARIFCTGMKNDPLFPDKVVLEGVQALTFPIQGYYLNTTHWSIPKDVVLNYMIGSLRTEFPVTPDMLEGKPMDVPVLPKTSPAEDMTTEPITHLVEKEDAPTPPPAAPSTPTPARAAPAAKPPRKR